MRAVTRRFRQRARDVRGEEGATILETAIASMIFLALLIGVFQMMMVLYTFNYVSDAAREGSRYAMVRGSRSCTNTPSLSNCNASGGNIQTYVRGRPYPGITASKLTLTTSWLTASATQPTSWSTCTSGTCNAPGNQVKVVASYSYPLAVPFVPKLTFNLSSSSKMVIAQ